MAGKEQNGNKLQRNRRTGTKEVAHLATAAQVQQNVQARKGQQAVRARQGQAVAQIAEGAVDEAAPQESNSSLMDAAQPPGGN